MSTETTPNGAATADRSVELVNRLLKLPEDVKLNLAHLLLDSVRGGFTSLEEVEKRDKELIHKRIEQVVKGEVKLLDAEDMFAAIKRRVEQAGGEGVPLLDWRESFDRIETKFREKYPQ